MPQEERYSGKAVGAWRARLGSSSVGGLEHMSSQPSAATGTGVVSIGKLGSDRALNRVSQWASEGP